MKTIEITKVVDIPETGDTVQPDGWDTWGILTKGSDYSDTSFPGCEFYLKLDKTGAKYAVNITLTGRGHVLDIFKDAYDKTVKFYKRRCRVEFVHDGQPNEFSGAWIYYRQ
jgi:hypothetical protein